MDKIRTFLLLFALLNCNSSGFSQHASIIGGEPITIEQVPFQVSIERNQVHHCGGVILNPEWILTAAHCVQADVEYIVHAGATDQTNNNIGQRIVADTKYLHDYDAGTRENDIALIHLSRPLCFDNSVQSIALPDPSMTISTGMDVYISGYGADGQENTGVLKGADTKIISNEHAEALFATAQNNGLGICPLVSITASMISLFKSGSGASGGDSGGPATITQNGSKVLIGITNFGCNAVNPPNTLPSIYANVKEHLQFILPFISQYNTSEDFVITNTTSIDQKLIPGNIIVTATGVLNITDDLYFKENKAIYIQSGGIVNISGDAKLDNCPHTGGWAGLEVQSGGTLIVDGATIRNADKAIHALSGSYLEIQNIRIFGQSPYSGTGILINGDVTISELNNVTIENYREGIFAYNGTNNLYELNTGNIKNTLYAITSVTNSLIVQNYDISNTSYGILIYNGPGSTVTNSTIGYSEYGIIANWSPFTMINNNTIGIPGQTGKIGVSLFQSNHSNILYNPLIQARNLGVRVWSSQAIIAYNSINLSGTNNQYGGGVLSIDSHNSVIEENYLDINQSAFGIETNISTGTIVQNNKIDHFSSISTRSAAIRSMAGMDERIDNNIINGVANTTGILAQNTTSNQYLCNITDNTAEGLGIYYNSEMHNIRGNEFGSWIDLALRSQVGPQVHHGNKFKGGKARADELILEEIFNSQFFVNGTIPFLMPTDIIPSSEWFFDELNANTYECTGMPGPSWTPFKGWDETELCNYWKYLKDIRSAKPEMFFVKLYHLLKYTKSKPGLILPDCIRLDQVFTEVCGVQRLADIAASLQKTDSPSLNVTGLNTYQTQYSLQTTEEGRNNVKNQLHSELSTLMPGVQSRMTAYSLRLDSINVRLDSIDCTSAIVNKWKTIFTLYAKYLSTNQIDTSDHPVLMSYATECADIYGDAIHIARAMVNTYDTTYFDVYDQCITPVTPRSRVKTGESPFIKVYPNPTNGVMYLNMPYNYTGNVTIRDINGKLVYEKHIISGNLTNIDLNMYSGVYFLVFTSDAGAQSIHKVILIK